MNNEMNVKHDNTEDGSLIIRLASGCRIQVMRFNGKLDIKGQLYSSDLEELSDKIRSGKFKIFKEDDFGCLVGKVNIGIRTIRAKDKTEYDSPLKWVTDAFNILEVKGDASSGKTDFLRSLMYEVRDGSHVFMIDPYGHLGVGLPVNQWEFSKEGNFGLGLFQPYGVKNITRDDTESTKLLAIDFLKSALDLTPGQHALLNKHLSTLYDKYWREISAGSKGRPRFPTLRMLYAEVSEEKGTPAVGLNTHLKTLFDYGPIFDKPMPKDSSAGVFSYNQIKGKLKDLISYVLLSKIALAPYRTMLLFEYSDLPWPKLERRNDVFTSLFRDVEKGKLLVAYTINQDDNIPKYVKLAKNKLLSVQLKHDSHSTSVMKPVYQVGYGRVTGRNQEFWMRIPSLSERVNMEDGSQDAIEGGNVKSFFIEELSQDMTDNMPVLVDGNEPLLQGLIDD